MCFRIVARPMGRHETKRTFTNYVSEASSVIERFDQFATTLVRNVRTIDSMKDRSVYW